MSSSAAKSSQDAGAPGSLKLRWQHWKAGHPALLHHLRAAVAVASVVTLLHSSGALGWLDNVSFQLIASARPATQVVSTSAVDMPVVALIPASSFERDFQQSSPLSPLALARLLERVPLDDALRPSQVVLDIDLSPTMGVDKGSGETGRASLDAALRRLVVAGVRVVLPLPVRVETSELQQTKFRWLKALCQWNRPGDKPGLVLASADVAMHNGVITRWDSDAPTLGNLAAETGSTSTLCDLVLDPTRDTSGLLLSTLADARFLPSVPGGEGLKPFNAEFFSRANTYAALDAIGQQGPGTTLARRALFIGGAYDERDRFVLPLASREDKVAGVVIHAATYFSALHPVGRLEGLSAFVLDLLLGIGLGYAFAWSWSWHQSACDVRSVRPGSLGAQLFPRVTLLANFALAAMTLYLCMTAASTVFYPFNLWIDPGPIVVGMFAKFVLASRKRHGHANHTTAPGSPHRLDADRLLGRVDTVALIVLATGAVWVVLAGHH